MQCLTKDERQTIADLKSLFQENVCKLRQGLDILIVIEQMATTHVESLFNIHCILAADVQQTSLFILVTSRLMH